MKPMIGHGMADGTPKPIRGRGRVTVSGELRNRDNCRYGLKGVAVKVDGMDPPVAIKYSFWDETGRLMLRLAVGGIVPAERLELASIWPVCCCPPKRLNRFNSHDGEFVYEGDLET